ncbi:MAG: PadR family transcriptional regulator [Chloroflexi bacterium HGW-Chloroflexi-10]|nr:MAG: PadR family transcriptional regulator [Chloroflexi bacterium HGW-Chloroflexi-10]
MNLNKFLPMTETTYYIMLSLLVPLHGYGIMQQVRELSRGNVELAPGTLYGALENLKKQKLIVPVSEDGESRRKTYLLTDLGREVLTLEYERMQSLISVSTPILYGEK